MTETFQDLPAAVQLIAVCHTPGCPVEDEECLGTYYPAGGFDPPRYMGQCGRCMQPITDLRHPPATVPAPEPEPEEPPAPTPVPVEPFPG